MKTHKGFCRIIDTPKSLCIGKYYYEGGTDGEFVIEWEKINDVLSPKLISYDDSWKILWEFKDLLEKMAKMPENITYKKLIEELIELGYIDFTNYPKKS